MNQCKLIHKDGKRCTNKADVDSDFCSMHLIKFEKIEDKEIKNIKNWVAKPISADTKPKFPEINPDNRNVLSAPQAIIKLSEKESNYKKINANLAKILSKLSQKMVLPGFIKIWSYNGYYNDIPLMIQIFPNDPNAPDLSSFYDMVASASKILDGKVFIGKDLLFIQYRDTYAPRGYDSEIIADKSADTFYLVSAKGAEKFPVKMLKQENLQAFLLNIFPVSSHKSDLPEVCYVLASFSLYRLISNYLREHHLNYQIAPLTSPNDNLIMFKIMPYENSPTGKFIPGFIIDYVESLPRCALFVESVPMMDKKRQALTQWGYDYPCCLLNILEAFPENSLLLIANGICFKNNYITPAPAFFYDYNLVFDHSNIKKYHFKPENELNSSQFKIKMRIIKDTDKNYPTSALILNKIETKFINILLYRIPMDAFEKYTFCQDNKISILIGEESPIESIPFGIGFRRFQNTSLFIPLQTKLFPNVALQHVLKIFDINDEVYTFITNKRRIDVPKKSLMPISKFLFTEDISKITFNPKDQTELPQIDWILPDESDLKDTNKFKIDKTNLVEPAKTHASTIIDTPETATDKDITETATDKDITEIIRQKAISFQQQGEYLNAAVCFSLINDHYNTAHCFKTAGQKIKGGG